MPATTRSGPADILQAALAKALEAVDARSCMSGHWPVIAANSRPVLFALGKAAGAMASAALDHYGPALEGLVVTRHGHGEPLRQRAHALNVIEAGHPVPDLASLRAGQAARDLALGLGPDDHLIALISGGGSALMVAPAAGLTLADKIALNRALLASGLPIAAMNAVRRHLSRVKGGRLALAAFPARVSSRLISDVTGDDPAMIASGPTLADPTTLEEARAALQSAWPDAPAHILAALNDPANETPKPDHPALHGHDHAIVASGRDAIAAAEVTLKEAGFTVHIPGHDLCGEASALGQAHALHALELLHAGGRHAILSGGECTVTLGSDYGRGGPNAEYALALALTVAMHDSDIADIHVLACDTDGTDGSEHNAGAHIAPGLLARAHGAGSDPHRALARHDSYTLLEATGDLLVTGPTLTNVNDLRIVLIGTGAP
jgi:hydroxypyruvate reductase